MPCTACGRLLYSEELPSQACVLCRATENERWAWLGYLANLGWKRPLTGSGL